MSKPIAAWRLSYAPGPWLALAGPTMLVALPQPAPEQAERVQRLWQEIVAAPTLDALLGFIAEAGLGELPDLAAFFWDEAGLHGFARGQVSVFDADSGEVSLSGAQRLTWQESALGQRRRLRVQLGAAGGSSVKLPLVVGAAHVSEIVLSTEPADVLTFGPGGEGILAEAVVPVPQPVIAEAVAEPVVETPVSAPDPALSAPDLLGDETVSHPEKSDRNAAEESGSLDKDSGTVSSPALAATHKPQPEEQQVVAVPCANGHANSPSFLHCRLCQAPVDPSQPRLINRPVLAGVHTNRGDFVDVASAVVIGRAPDPNVAPVGAQLMRVVSPSNDISRNHLMVSTQGWNVTVTDLHSTNGTTVLPVGEAPFMLADGASVEVAIGTVLDLGDGVSIRIEPPRG